MRLFQAPLDTSLYNLFLCQPLSSRFALHGLRAFEQKVYRLMFLKYRRASRFTPLIRGKPYQKNPRVRKIRVRISGAGNGCANFMGA